MGKWDCRGAAPGVPARRAVAGLLLACQLCLVRGADAEAPTVHQQILFGTSFVSQSGADQWLLHVQGRVFEPAWVSAGREAVIEALAPTLGAARNDALYLSRAGDLLSDSVRNRRIGVVLGGQAVRLPPSDASGCFAADITLSGERVRELARDGLIAFESEAAPDGARSFAGAAIVVSADGVIVVTDVDDTIKATDVNNRAEARANTFLRPFRPVPGMPELYRDWKAAGGPRVHFHVVSAGPWQFHEPLQRFARDSGFPDFTWDMRCVDATDPATIVRETVKADPRRLYEFKLKAIRALMGRFPNRHVVLVGDSGEMDPETYGRILAEFPDRVDAVFIHNVTGQGRDAARYRQLYPDAVAAGKLQVFVQPAELPRRL